jgi:hypothetical protein
LIRDLGELKKLKDLENLKFLDIVGNPLVELTNYADKVFSTLPNIEVLDGIDPEGNEVATDEDDFQEDQD